MSIPIQDEHTLTKKAFWKDPENALCLVFVLYAVFYSLWQFFGYTFDRIPGDLIDSRFNNYILEHGYRYLCGRDASFWNAPFNYPEPNIMAYSDSFLGQLPFYAFFRVLGFNRESAYQCWLISAYLLNFFVCAWVCFKLSGNKTASIVGAYIFAFGTSILDQSNHTQMTARYPIALAFYFLILFLRQQRHRWFLLFLGSMLLLFLNSIYLGFLLSLGLVPFGIGYLLVYRKELSFRAFFRPKQLLLCGIYLLGFGLLMHAYFLPYIKHSALGNFSPNREDVFESLPRLTSYLMTSKEAASWQSLWTHPDGLKNFYNHFLFPGGMVMLSMLLLVVVSFWRRFFTKSPVSAPQLKLARLFLFSFVCLLLLTVRSRYLMLYKYVYPIPGFGVMRDLCRVVNIEFFLYALIAALFSAYFLSKITKTWVRMVISSLLLFLLFFDLHYDYEMAGTYSKAETQHDCRALADKIKQTPAYNTYEAVAFMPEKDDRFTFIIHLDAMLACQDLGIKTVNSYTGTCPGSYCHFASMHSMDGLKEWFSSVHLALDSTRILIVR